MTEKIKIPFEDSKGLLQRIEISFDEVVKNITRNPNNFKLSVSVSNEIINRVLKDKDVIENYHGEMRGSDIFKVLGYLTYWIAKLKPVQIIEENPDDEEVLINEKLAIVFADNYLYEHNKIRLFKDKQLEDNLLYLLRYRTLTVRILPVVYEAYIKGFKDGANKAGKVIVKELNK